MRNIRAAALLAACAGIMLFASEARAQSTGSIAGTVKDATGAVLPGVTVEAASPALIEKVRTAVTDAQGNYQVASLRPGTYTVTFTLPGFSSVKREGIELTANFTANVNVDLKVGSVEETITVTTASPIVDLQNVTQQRSISRTIIDSLPTNRTFQGLAVLIPGVVSQGQDVGGSTMSGFGVPLTVHGSKGDEMPMMLDGLKFNNMKRAGGGSSMLYRLNSAVAEEITVEVSGMGAENSEGGLIVNTVPKEGGNAYHGTLFSNYTNNNFQASNLTSALLARGAASVPSTRVRYEINGAMGGPLVQNRLWFFGGVRFEKSRDRQPNVFYAVNPAALTYTADTSKPLDVDAHYQSYSGRATWQASQRNKFSGFFDKQPGCICNLAIGAGGFYAGEAAADVVFTGNYLAQFSWKSPLTNRLLFEAGMALSQQQEYYNHFDDLGPRYMITESSTGLVFHGPPAANDETGRTWSGRALMSYVTGSHAVKVGSQWQYGFISNVMNVYNDKQLTFLRGQPSSVTLFTTPYSIDVRTAPNLGMFAQDQWKIGRFTLNGGLRFEYTHTYTPPYEQAPVQYVGTRSFPKIDNIPNWKDIVPRLGVAWDVFGQGKTAIKGSLGKYVVGVNGAIAFLVAPSVTSVNSATASWTDDGDFIPEANELGPPSNSNFGKSVITQHFDSEAMQGWNHRPYTWEGTLGIQQELRPGLGVTATYVRRSRGNFFVTDNVSVSPSDYDPFCVTSPVDARLPGGGNQQVCSYNINPLKFGQISNLVTLASKYGDASEVFNGVDLSLNARLPKGLLLQGGTSTGRLVTDNCDVVGKVDNGASGASTAFGGIISFDNPQNVASPSTLYCRVVPPLLTQLKLSGVYPLPWWGIQASASFQSVPGAPYTATFVATNEQIFPSLKRPLAGGLATANVQLIAPFSRFGDRLNQLDFRATKTFVVGGARVQGQFDLYNALNANPVLGQNNTYGQAWLRPSSILSARIAKLGVQIDF